MTELSEPTATRHPAHMSAAPLLFYSLEFQAISKR